MEEWIDLSKGKTMGFIVKTVIIAITIIVNFDSSCSIAFSCFDSCFPSFLLTQGYCYIASSFTFSNYYDYGLVVFNCTQ